MSALPALPVLPAAANLSPTLPQAPTAAGDTAPSVSFEAVLAAQLGIQSLADPAPVPAGVVAPDADPQQAPAPKETKTKDAPVADAAAAGLLFIPVATAASPATSDLAAKPDQASAARTEVIAAPRPLPASLAESRAVQAEQQPESATEARLTAPAAATLADDLQSLPAPLPADDKPAPASGRPVQAVLAPPDSPPALPVQAAHVAETTAPAAHADASVPGPVGDPRWGDAFSQRVVWMVGQKLQSAEFRVEPPQLGPIEVRLSITNDQANLLFNAPHAVAREAIQTSLPRLQEMLLESGVALGNVSVGTGSRQDQTDFAFGRSSARGAGAPAAASSTAGIEVAVRRGIGLVDLFA